jgi:uncharacterized membrane protein
MTRAALRQTWDRLRTSYWFLPVLAALLAFLLARLLLQLDAQLPNELLNESKLIFSTTPEEARIVMIGLAGTVLATAGIVFSLLTLPLSLVAGQFGSRLLRIYVRDGPIQFVLAVFVGTFVYCLVLAPAIPIGDGIEGPQLSTTAGLALSLVSFGSLLVLIHHIASALQAPNLVAAASRELESVIGLLIDQTNSNSEDNEPAAEAADEGAMTTQIEREGVPIYASRHGYIQDIDTEVALGLATRHDLVVHLIRKSGHFVEAGQLIAIVAPAAREHTSCDRHRRCVPAGHHPHADAGR